MRHERVEQPYIGIYDEIDDSLVGMDNRDPILEPHLRNNRAIITGVRTMTKDNDEEDNSSYLDPFFAVDGTDCQSSFKDSSSNNSSNPDNVIPDDTGYLNPYQPLCEREQNIADGYKVAVYVGHNSGNSSGSDSFENGSSIDRHYHVHQQLQQGQRKNTDEYVKATTTYNEQEINYSEKNKKDSCRNKVSANKNSIASGDLLYN
ncbi:unnamed protein product [Mytilus coruscus]|uniref:Uncharacterized protein n=1 Tax=Mytilus coruscus TaxID=42192 RepID=A0A6J8DTQ8_MYTCO|nr:unnamed protein product [Mytilus coruscus]